MKILTIARFIPFQRILVYLGIRPREDALDTVQPARPPIVGVVTLLDDLYPVSSLE